MPERMPKVVDRGRSHTPKDGSPGGVFNDTGMVSFAFLANTDGSNSMDAVANQASRWLVQPTKIELLSSDS
jgi:hypothetical protein